MAGQTVKPSRPWRRSQPSPDGRAMRLKLGTGFRRSPSESLPNKDPRHPCANCSPPGLRAMTRDSKLRHGEPNPMDRWDPARSRTGEHKFDDRGAPTNQRKASQARDRFRETTMHAPSPMDQPISASREPTADASQRATNPTPNEPVESHPYRARINASRESPASTLRWIHESSIQPPVPWCHPCPLEL